MPISREEKLRRKREAEKRRYDRMKQDPEEREKLRQKERDQYSKKKEKKIIRPISQLNEREKRAKRKEWRQTSKTYRQKRKQTQIQNEFLEQNTPPASPLSVENINEVHQVTPQSISGKRLAARNRKVRSRRSKEREKMILKLRKDVARYKGKYYRLKKKTKQKNRRFDQPSPKTRVGDMIGGNQTPEIAKKLLFAEAVSDQLKTNYEQLRGDKDKRFFRQILSGPIIKKYRMKQDLQKIVKGSKLTKSSTSVQNRSAMERCKKINAIWKFLESDLNSKMCPGKKDYCSRNGKIKQKRYLNDTMFNLHKIFLKKHPNIPVSYAFWCKNRPFHIVSKKVSSRDTCSCMVCLNMTLLIGTLSRLNVIKENNSNSVISSFCCENRTEKCLLRDCPECENKNIQFEDQNRCEMSFFYKWCSQKHTYFDNKTRKQKTVVKITKQKCLCSISKIVEEFESNIIKYLKHKGRAYHQYKIISELKKDLKTNEALIHMDFSENYNLKYAEEIQAFHFGGSRQQISLHTVVMYTNAGGKLKKECYCTLSECLNHNVPGIWAHLDPILKSLMERYPIIDTLHFVSDSPATQYRNKTMFFFLAVELSNLFPTIRKFSWNYLEAGHGKGAPDGVGGVTKRTADRLVAQGHDIASFDTLVTALSQNIKGITYLTVDASDVKRISERLDNKKMPIFKGTMKVHQVKKDLSQKAFPKLLFYSLSSLDEDDHTYLLGSKVYESANPLSPEEASDASSDEDLPLIRYSSTGTEIPNRKLNFNDVYSDDEEAGTSTDKTESILHNIKNGTFLLVQLKTKKVSYRYVAVAQNEIEEDGEVRVMFLKVCELNSKQVFKPNERDISYVTFDDILNVLPTPSMIFHDNKLFYEFNMGVDVFEK
ncbi:unnamed protein product [Phaedon cochleariae]|uniref:Uncharacterized protein n=1 Tax=Phaedon cochleariae TaxID=80249 RepID=A0A9P0GPD8_PHACE|nr:unnamed protein product [Phaedon cochleariae]